MTQRVNIKINTNQLNRTLKAIQERVERVLVGEMDLVLEVAAEEAEERFKNAVYDGSVDDIRVYVEETGPRTRTLIAEGDAVGYIEYGTGVGRDSGYINPTTKKPWWVFTAKGRNIKLNAGGKEITKRSYKRTTEDVYTNKYFANIGIGGGRTRIDPNSAEAKRRMSKRDGKLYYTVGGSPIFNPQTRSLTYRGGRDVPVTVTKEYQGSRKVSPYWVDGASRSGAYISSGNPANMIMEGMKLWMTSELLDKFRAKFK